MRTIALTSAMAAALAYTAATASAHYSGYRPDPQALKPRVELRYANRLIAHANWALTHYRTMVDTGKVLDRHYIRNHRWLLEHAVKLRSEARSRLLALLRPPHYRDWLCIHRYEGSWTDSGSPYYGGLQMDLGFQQTYGRHLLETKGTADHWTPIEQMWVAERAHKSRGFWPWPNTARYCGLL